MANEIRARNLLQNSSSGTASTYTTARACAEPNRLLLIGVMNSKATLPETPTVTGLGVTWVQVDSTVWDTGATQRRLTVLRALGTTASGTLAIAFGGVSQTSCGWCLVDYSYTDTTGTNGSGAIVQEVVATGSSGTGLSTLAAFGSANNATVGFFGHSGATTTTAGTGFGRVNTASINGMNITSEFRADNDTTVDATWTSVAWGAIGIEVKQGTAPSVPTGLPAVMGNSSGSSIFVSTGGNDSTGTGLVGAPYATITKALTVLSGNSIIEVRYDGGAAHVSSGTAGTAAGERFTCDFAGTSQSDPITIRTYPADRASGRALVNGEFFVGASSNQMAGNVKIQGLKITKRSAADNASSTSGDYGVRIELARNVEVSDCEVTSNNQGGVLNGGAQPFMGTENVQVFNNTIHDTGSSGAAHNSNEKHDHPVYWGGGSADSVYGGAVYNNLLYNTFHGFCAQLWGSGGGGTGTVSSRFCVFAYNTLWNSDTGTVNGNSVMIIGGGNSGMIDGRITSNIIKHSGTTGTSYGIEMANSGSGNFIDKNIIHEVRDGSIDAAITGGIATITGTITTDPLLTAPGSSDFTISGSSPAKAAGNSSFLPATDFFGATRVTADIGAVAAPAAAAAAIVRSRVMRVG